MKSKPEQSRDRLREAGLKPVQVCIYADDNKTKKQHGNTGKKNALKSGRSKQIGATRVTPVVYDYLKSGETSAADKIERLVMNEINGGEK